MCQQTQVATVLPYFQRWMERFPTVESLAAASEAEVLPLWQGLGYYCRCRMMLSCARQVAATGWPPTAEELRKLPGIGAYTAGEIAAICFNEASPAVDGNVERVYSRFKVDGEGSARLNRNAWKWAGEIVDRTSPGDWNQALMELGATICRPRNPLCAQCPLAASCAAFRTGTAEDLPVRPAKAKTTHITTHACVCISEGLLGVEQIAEGEWSHGLWRFSTQVPADAEEIGEVRHVVTRHQIRMKVHLCRGWHSHLRYVTFEELRELGMPSAHWKALALADASANLRR